MIAPTRRPRRPGNVLTLFAILLTSLIGMVAFAIDTGYIALYKNRLQRAADAAALAGSLKALSPPGTLPDITAVRAEVRKYVAFNMSGLTVRDEDIKLARYTPYSAPADRYTYTYSVTQPPNAVEVILRRDSLQNDPLKLFFAPVIGTKSTTLTARAVAYCAKGKSVKAGAPFLPYTMQYDYYYAAMGQTRTDPLSKNNQKIAVADNYTVNPANMAVSSGKDGVNEVVLFCQSGNKPGNFGSLDIGSNLNATGELERQILYGPTVADFANPDFYIKVNADGALYLPFVALGDTGMSTSVKTSFQAIVGQPRIIPLYGPAPGPDGVRGTADDYDLSSPGLDGVYKTADDYDGKADGVFGTGNTAQYNILGYAGVVITSVNFNGSAKGVTVQPAFIVSNKVTPATSDTDVVSEGVYLPPKLVIP